MSYEIDIGKVLDFMRDEAPKFAKAKAERVYLDEYKKSLKAILMQKAQERGVAASASQERDALADESYLSLLGGLKEAVEAEERLRWLLVAAQVKCEVWRSEQANNRFIDKVVT